MGDFVQRIFFISFLLVVLLGCKQEVGFTPAESTPVVVDPGVPGSASSDDEIVDDDVVVPDPVPLSPPVVHFVAKPKDHLEGGEATAVFEVVAGSRPIVSVQCFVDLGPLACDLSLPVIEISNLFKGKHKVSVVVTDEEGLTGTANSEWTIFDRFVETINSVKIEEWNDQADILFVIDNSISMEEEQKGIAKRISRFFEKIKYLDWRVGIITTDPYETNIITGQYNSLGDGALLKFPNGQYYIDSRLKLSKAKKLFSDTIFRPEQGNGHERGIHNTYRSIERAMNPTSVVNQRLAEFYRPKSAFSVVLISDENETLLNGVGKPLPDLHKSKGVNLVNYVKRVWGVKKLFQFNSVIVRPEDSSCMSDHEKFGYAYSELSKLTDGVVENICANDYSGALKNIGNGVANLQKRYTLDCVPQDIDSDGKPDLRVESTKSSKIPGYIISGDQLEFDKPLKKDFYQFKYYCPNLVP